MSYNKNYVTVKVRHISIGRTFMDILFYGDSNTYGVNPENGKRYDRDTRFTGLLQKELKNEHYLIEEGLPGRTTVCSDRFYDGLEGIKLLSPLLLSHNPDKLILMLGSNDMKKHFNMTPTQIGKGIEMLIQKCLNPFCSKLKKDDILIVSPPLVSNKIKNSTFYDSYGSEAIEKSLKLSEAIFKVCETYGVYFLDGSIVCGGCDGLHLDAEGHKILFKAIYKMIKEIWTL